MQTLDNNPPREKVTVKDFYQISKQNEFFVWHFLRENQCSERLELCSYFEEKKDASHTTKFLLDRIPVPYFESYTEESIDFLLDMGVPERFFRRKIEEHEFNGNKLSRFSPLFFTFNFRKMVGCSMYGCYCSEYLLEQIMNLNPNFILNANFD